ncbi:MAG TPA: hypothetical protein VF789_25310 [Thermoanaerobaculia bacterium]
MFIGHFALGMGAKKMVPEVSLGTLFLAGQFADLLWPTLLLAGVEVVRIQPGVTAVTPLDFVRYPYSHSLLALLVWAVLFSLAYLAFHRSRTAAAVTLGALVLSHWLLDFVVHRPDLPLTLGGSELFGLGLWDSLPATLAVELTLFAAGVALYARSTEALDRQGRWGFWSLVAFLLIVYFANLFGPPPPSVDAVAWTTQAMWLLVLWGWWVDRHRRPRDLMLLNFNNA